MRQDLVVSAAWKRAGCPEVYSKYLFNELLSQKLYSLKIQLFTDHNQGLT